MGFQDEQAHVSGLEWIQRSAGPWGGRWGFFLLFLPRNTPSPLPPNPTAVPRSPYLPHC